LTKILYDQDCPVCRSFAKLLKKKFPPETLLTVPMNPADLEDAESFCVELPDGQRFFDRDAVHQLAERHPDVKGYFWMLPPGYREEAMFRTYRMGRLLRRIMNIGRRRKCNC